MEKTVVVEISARHIHLCEQDVETLFGKGYQLTNIKDLSQPGQFACAERVSVIGPKRTLANVSILGPTRVATQLELSLTDARTIGVNAPVRESGDIAESGTCKIEGPCGTIELSCGVIAAKRHIHATPADAEKYGLNDKQIVRVAITGQGRNLVFDDVVVRVNPTYALAMHIDTDESNAAAMAPNTLGTILA